MSNLFKLFVVVVVLFVSAAGSLLGQQLAPAADAVELDGPFPVGATAPAEPFLVPGTANYLLLRNAPINAGFPVVRVDGKIQTVTFYDGRLVKFLLDSSVAAGGSVMVQVFFAQGGRSKSSRVRIGLANGLVADCYSASLAGWFADKGQAGPCAHDKILPKATLTFNGPFNAALLTANQNAPVPNSMQTLYFPTVAWSGTPKVKVNGVDAQISYAGLGCGNACRQINFLFPGTNIAPVNSSASIQVTSSAGDTSTPKIVLVKSSGPGLYQDSCTPLVPFVQDPLSNFVLVGPCQQRYLQVPKSGAYVVLYGNAFGPQITAGSVTVTGSVTGTPPFTVTPTYVGRNDYPGQWQLNLLIGNNGVSPGAEQQQIMTLTINGQSMVFRFWLKNQ